MRLELRGVTKRFPGVVANDHIDLVVEDGEVHGLLGENGAGKSTLMNILYGLYSADEGDILIDGQPAVLRDPADAIARGIGMVHQHFMLVPVFTVAENVVLGVELTSGLGRLDRRRAASEVAALSERFGLPVDPEALVDDLPVGVQQRVEILKALYRDARLLILDEPTAVLTPREVDDLFEAIRALRDDGRSIVFISHKLREHRAVADRVSVLRRGRLVGTADPREVTEQQLAEMMVGRAVELVVDKDDARPGEPMLQVEDLVALDGRGEVIVDGVSFEVRRGEIVAIAGVEGNGQTALVEAVTGLREAAGGRVLVRGRDLARLDRKSVLRGGVGHVPENRGRDGLVGRMSVAENLVLALWDAPPFARRGVLDFDAIRRHAEREVDAFDIRTPSVDTTAASLSGGNQQKVVCAREFHRDSDVLVAAQPTRGLDVGSIEYIHRQIVAKRDEGAAVLIVSSELDEVLALADRVAVMFQGRLVGPFDMPVDRDAVGLMMAGAAPDAALGRSAPAPATAAAGGSGATPARPERGRAG